MVGVESQCAPPSRFTSGSTPLRLRSSTCSGLRGIRMIGFLRRSHRAVDKETVAQEPAPCMCSSLVPSSVRWRSLDCKSMQTKTVRHLQHLPLFINFTAASQSHSIGRGFRLANDSSLQKSRSPHPYNEAHYSNLPRPHRLCCYPPNRHVFCASAQR